MKNKPGQKRILTDEQIAEIMKRYRNGESLVKMAPEYFVSKTTLRNYLSQNGYTSLPKRPSVFDGMNEHDKRIYKKGYYAGYQACKRRMVDESVIAFEPTIETR